MQKLQLVASFSLLSQLIFIPNEIWTRSHSQILTHPKEVHSVVSYKTL